MSEIRRISLFGGPGSGKSTNAAYLFYKMKMLGHHVELVTEIAKRYAYENIEIKGDVQLECAARQQAEEEFWLSHGVKYVVTDSPLLLQYMYAMNRGEVEMAKEVLLPQALDFEDRFPSLNLFLNRKGVPYQAVGRYQKTLQEAEFFDSLLHNTIFRRLGVPYVAIKSINRKQLLEAVTDRIDKPTLPVNPLAEGLASPMGLWSRLKGLLSRQATRKD